MSCSIGRTWIAALFAASLVTGAPALAQKKPKTPFVVSGTMIARLALSAEQQAKWKAADETLQKELQAAKGRPAADAKQVLGPARQAFEEAVGGLLTPAQRSLLETMQERAWKLRALGAAAPQVAGLDLQEAQVTRIEAIAASYEPEVDMLRQADKSAVIAAVRELNARIMGEVRSVLTPEQQKQIEPPAKKKGE